MFKTTSRMSNIPFGLSFSLSIAMSPLFAESLSFFYPKEWLTDYCVAKIVAGTCL
jgi:hypothetical protein